MEDRKIVAPLKTSKFGEPGSASDLEVDGRFVELRCRVERGLDHSAYEAVALTDELGHSDAPAEDAVAVVLDCRQNSRSSGDASVVDLGGSKVPCRSIQDALEALDYLNGQVVGVVSKRPGLDLDRPADVCWSCPAGSLVAAQCHDDDSAVSEGQTGLTSLLPRC